MLYKLAVSQVSGKIDKFHIFDDSGLILEVVDR